MPGGRRTSDMMRNKSMSSVRRRAIFSTLIAAGMAAAASLAEAQSLSYSRGQTVSPAYEGWQQDADGTRYFVFGYMNRNWEEEVVVPVGAENGFNLGNADQGQPTRFLPRRNRFVFRVRVPEGFTEKDELIWTLTTYGHTERAYATLRTDYFIDNVVIMSETGSLGAGTSSPEVRANIPPTITLQGDATRTAKVGQPLSLVVMMKDDGIPKLRTANVEQIRSAREAASSGEPIPPVLLRPPSRVTVGKMNGLHLSWFVYRGAGDVTFDPPQVKVWEDTRAGANSPWAPLWVPPELPEDGRIEANVTFSQPGTYVLRARADDGGLFSDLSVTVTVTP